MLECPVASETCVVYVTVVPELCCPLLRLNVFCMFCPVSPAPPEPTLTTVSEPPSPKSHVYVCVAEKSEFEPGNVSVPFLNVTGKPLVPSSLTPLTVESAMSIFAVCVE